MRDCIHTALCSLIRVLQSSTREMIDMMRGKMSGYHEQYLSSDSEAQTRAVDQLEQAIQDYNTIADTYSFNASRKTVLAVSAYLAMLPTLWPCVVKWRAVVIEQQQRIVETVISNRDHTTSRSHTGGEDEECYYEDERERAEKAALETLFQQTMIGIMN